VPCLYEIGNDEAVKPAADQKNALPPEGARRATVRVMSSEETGRQMPVETPVTIFLNEQEIATVQATPQELGDLAVGFLRAEGLLSDRQAFIGTDVDARRGMVYVTTREPIPDDLGARKRYLTSGCGKGITFSSAADARALQPLEANLSMSADELYRWMALLADRSVAYKSHGGYHSCGLVIDRELCAVREDIGRHNAVDKVLGHAWLEGLDLSCAILLASGRVSYEMIVKVAKNRVPVICSRSAATDLATQIAQKLGITLAGYIRGGKVVIYAHPERIVAGVDNAR